MGASIAEHIYGGNMSYSTILYEIEESILTITLNRPEALNAFNNDMLEELLDACDRADADDNVKAIIVTGAGRAFCAGADLSSGGKTFNSDARADRKSGVNPDGGGRLTLRLYELNKPIIAAINGPAVGVGVTMTLAMDIRLASSQARSRIREKLMRMQNIRMTYQPCIQNFMQPLTLTVGAHLQKYCYKYSCAKCCQNQ